MRNDKEIPIIDQAISMLDIPTILVEANLKLTGGIGTVKTANETATEFGIEYQGITVNVVFLYYQDPDGGHFPAIKIWSGEKVTPDNGLVINLSTIKDDAFFPSFRYGVEKAISFANRDLDKGATIRALFPQI